MEQSKLELFMQTKGKFFPPEKIYSIREMLEKADDNKANLLNVVPFKSPTTVVLFALFLGGLGIDRFITNSKGIGILKIVAFIIGSICRAMAAADHREFGFLIFITAGVFVWFIVEVFTASKRAKEYNYQKLIEILGNR